MIHWNQLEIAQRKFFFFEEISKTQLLSETLGRMKSPFTPQCYCAAAIIVVGIC